LTDYSIASEGLTAIGPLGLEYINSNDDPRSGSTM